MSERKWLWNHINYFQEKECKNHKKRVSLIIETDSFAQLV